MQDPNDPSVDYQGPENGPFMCGHCEYFVQPQSCSKVSGVIDPKGCCNLYSSINQGNPLSLGGLKSASRLGEGIGGSSQGSGTTLSMSGGMGKGGY
jgi:hypothetical protein